MPTPPPPPGRPTVGGPAPAIDLPSVQGPRWRSVDHLGRPIVLVFHRHIH